VLKISAAERFSSWSYTKAGFQILRLGSGADHRSAITFHHSQLLQCSIIFYIFHSVHLFRFFNISQFLFQQTRGLVTHKNR
jgi:hypothetical protein